MLGSDTTADDSTNMGLALGAAAPQRGANTARWAAKAKTDRRPYENYYAQIARMAYPEMDMGRELLRLNLGIIPGHGDRPYIREIIRS